MHVVLLSINAHLFFNALHQNRRVLFISIKWLQFLQHLFNKAWTQIQLQILHNLVEFNRFLLINVKETSYSKNVHGLVDRH